MIIGREVRDHGLAVTVIRLHLVRSHSRRHPHRWIRIGLGIKLLYVRPFAAEANALQHSFALQQLQHVSSDTLVLHVQNQPYIFFPSKAEYIHEERDFHALEPVSHPDASVAKSQVVVITRFCIANSVGEPFQNTVVIQYDLSVQGPPQINLHHVATQQGSLLQ